MRIPLSVKISTSVVAAVLTIVSLLLVNAYFFLVNNEAEDLKNNVHIDVTRMQNTLEFLAQQELYEQVQVEVSSFSSIRYVNYVVLLNEDGNVVASSRLAYVGERLEDVFANQVDQNLILEMMNAMPSKSNMWVDKDRKKIIAMYPVVLGVNTEQQLLKSRTGYIYLDVDLEWIERKALHTLQLKAQPVVILLFIMVVFFMLLHNKLLVQRIESINFAARKFSASGYKARVHATGNDELTDLAISFNEMASTVEAKNTELVKKEQRISLILDTMEDGLITIDEECIVQSFNRAAEKMFGYEACEVIGKNVSLLMPEPYHGQHDSYVRAYLTTGKKNIMGTGRDVQALRKDGSIFFMHLSINEFADEVDGKRRFIGSCADVSILKEQEQQLRHSQKMDALGKLTGGIAHDYNNMLGVILGYAELLMDQLPADEKLHKYINEIYYAGTRGARLTKKLLSFSRQKTTEPDIVNLNDLLQQNKNMLEKTLTARISLVFSFYADLWPVYIDSSDLEDSVLNMCINAMHAIENTGVITIETSNIEINSAQAIELKLGASGDYVCLRIIDTGKGIDEDTVSRIFDPFFSTKGDKGSGLGLSQVYGFMKRSSGAVNVESFPGKGTVFELYFPRYSGAVDQKTDSNAEALAMKQEANLARENILVVDDELSLRQLLDETLTSVGYQVYTAEDSSQAIEWLKKVHIDVVISDVIMPGMDGYQLAEYIKEHFPDVKIQLASGFSDDRHLAVKDSELHKNLLQKPYERQQLLDRVRKLLQSG